MAIKSSGKVAYISFFFHTQQHPDLAVGETGAQWDMGVFSFLKKRMNFAEAIIYCEFPKRSFDVVYINLGHKLQVQ